MGVTVTYWRHLSPSEQVCTDMLQTVNFSTIIYNFLVIENILLCVDGYSSLWFGDHFEKWPPRPSADWSAMTQYPIM